ncbi:MAG: hypothetical protein WCQ21_25530, partial [Verrucomicrobiota bacterium]
MAGDETPPRPAGATPAPVPTEWLSIAFFCWRNNKKQTKTKADPELIATPAEQPPIESGHARNSELPPITPMGADN